MPNTTLKTVKSACCPHLTGAFEGKWHPFYGILLPGVDNLIETW